MRASAYKSTAKLAFVYIMYSCKSVCVCVIISEHRAQSKKGETCVRASTLLYSSALEAQTQTTLARLRCCCCNCGYWYQLTVIVHHFSCVHRATQSRARRCCGGRNRDHRVTTMLKSMCGNVCLYYTRLCFFVRARVRIMRKIALPRSAHTQNQHIRP